MAKTISQLIIEYFKQHPNENLDHGPVVDWVTEQYEKQTGRTPRDVWRAIRKLHEEGKLIKVMNGIYKYDPEYVHNVELEDFTEEQKQIILKRDGYKCVICGRGIKDGVTLHVDHIKPKSKGGKATIDNGQTLCSIHNFRKKNYSQTESGKKMFIRLYEKAKAIDDKETMGFCAAILRTYEAYDVNGYIEWNE